MFLQMEKEKLEESHIHFKSYCIWYVKEVGIFLRPVLNSQGRLKGTDVTQYSPNLLHYNS